MPARGSVFAVPVLAGIAIALARRLRSVVPLGCLGGLVCTLWHIESRIDDRLAAELAGRDVAVTGWVDDFPRRGPDQTSFSFRVSDGAGSTGVPERLRLIWYDPPAAIDAGTTLELTVRLRQPRGLSNPGGFDYERWLFVEGYGATGYVREGRVAAAPAKSVARRWLELRGAIAGRIAAAVDEPDARALLTALALGERYAFDESHWTTLRRTGTSHLVAISGLHVGIVSALLFFIVRWILLRGPGVVAARDAEAASVSSFAGAAIYAALAGFSVPTQRALVMLAIVLASVALRRSTAMASGLSVALLVILIGDPLATLSASFWLSFVAVALLWQFGLRRAVSTSGRRTRLRRALGAVRVQWAITLGLLPVVAGFFGEVSLAAPLINLLAIPVCALVLVPLTLFATLGLALEPVGTLLLEAAAQLTTLCYGGLEWVARAPWAAVTWPALGFARSFLLWAGVACVLPIHGFPSRYLGWIAILAAVIGETGSPELGGFRATVLDVGHGLAVIVRTHGHTLVYDAGPRFRSGFDAGAEIVVPALRNLGANLDVVVVSHADSDHAGGLAAVRAAYPDAVTLAGPDLERVDTARCRAGQRWDWDGVAFEMLYPPAGLSTRGNDSSCVLRIRAGGTALILLGDLERNGERSLVTAGGDLGAAVAVVPHHGSATSSSSSLVFAVGARYAVVSAAHANRWGFPKPDVVARWRQAGSDVIVTGEVGAVGIAVTPDGRLSIDTQRPRRQRPWQPENAEAPGYSLVL